MNIHREYAAWRAGEYDPEKLRTFSDLAAFSAAVREPHPLRLSAEIGKHLVYEAREEIVAIAALTPNHRLVVGESVPSLHGLMQFPVISGESWVETASKGFEQLTGLRLQAPRLTAIVEGYERRTSQPAARRVYVMASVSESYYLCGGKPGFSLAALGNLIQQVVIEGVAPASVLTAIAAHSPLGWDIGENVPFFYVRT